MRACRSAAMFSLPEAAAAAGISESAARKAMAGLVWRGRCAELASLMLASSTVSADDAERAAKQAAPPAVRLIGDDGSENVRAAAAGAAGWTTRRDLLPLENAPRSVIAVAAASDDENSVAAATLDACPSGVLTRLASSSDWEARACAALNGAATPAVLALLACDNDPDVSYAVATNPAAAPLALITAVAHGSEATASEVYEGALDAACRIHKQLHLSAYRAQINKLHHALGSNPFPAVRVIAASSDRCPSQVMARLARDDETDVRSTVAAHYGCPDDILAVLATDREQEVQTAVAANPNCGSVAAEALAASLKADIDPDRALAVIYAMAGNESSSETRIAAASHRYWAEMVVDGLARDYDVNVRAVVAASTDCAPETLEMLAQDDDYVRVVVASNFATPEETLQQLTQDDTLEVVDAATAAMQRRNLSASQRHI